MAKGFIVHADGKFILLNENGQLLLVRPGEAGLDVLATAQVLTPTSWTPPSLVGTTLYLRDRHHVLALSLK